MNPTNRRNFLKKTFSGIAGSTLLIPSAKETLLAKAKSIEMKLDVSSDSENYWDVVKNHFSLQKGLHYFNNASLGPSPELVLDATEKFRRALESNHVGNRQKWDSQGPERSEAWETFDELSEDSIVKSSMSDRFGLHLFPVSCTAGFVPLPRRARQGVSRCPTPTSWWAGGAAVGKQQQLVAGGPERLL